MNFDTDAAVVADRGAADGSRQADAEVRERGLGRREAVDLRERDAREAHRARVRGVEVAVLEAAAVEVAVEGAGGLVDAGEAGLALVEVLLVGVAAAALAEP